MPQDALPLGDDAPTTGRRGAARAAVERTLKAWREAGHYVGPEFAAAVRVLRDSADAVDAAARHMEFVGRCTACGAPAPSWVKPGTPYTLAFTNKVHAELLTHATPSADAGADPYGDTDDDDALASALAAALTGDDGSPAPPAGDAPGSGAD